MRLKCPEESQFSEPLPWIGLYIAAASVLCSLLMGLNTSLLCSLGPPIGSNKTTSGSQHLHATPQEQLTKLSGTVLICTVMGNFITSLGTMNGSEMITNVVAPGILVVTVIVNIAIQMGTSAIYVFLPENAVSMVFMLVLLVILCSTAITAPTAKELLEEQYNEVLHSDDEVLSNLKLREYVKKHWMIAHTSCPQYLVGRFTTCTASGVFCLLSALILLQAAVRSLSIRSLAFCEGKSDYTWSMTLVLISQEIAIGVGAIAPGISLFNAISFGNPKGEFKEEKYWVQKLVEWKESPLPFHSSNRGPGKSPMTSEIKF